MDGIPLEELFIWLTRWCPYFLACYSSYSLLFAPDSIFNIYYFAGSSQSGWEIACLSHFSDGGTEAPRLTQDVLITNTYLINGEAQN